MPLYTSDPGVSGITPDQVVALLVTPLLDSAVATRVSTIILSEATNSHIPAISEDTNASWVTEGEVLPEDNPKVTDTIVRPSKIAALTIISNELASDSSPDARQIVGDSMVRDIARKVDIAYFGNLAAPAPAGLESLTDVSEVDAGASWENLDPFAEAQAIAEFHSSTVGAFCANPADVLSLATIKTGTGSNAPLLGPDPTAPTQRVILGVPVFSSPAVTAGTVWAIPQDRSIAIVRKEATIDVSDQAFFTSDRYGIRAIMRIGFAFPQPAAIVKISLS